MNCVVLCDANGNSVIATDENPGDVSYRKSQEHEREPPRNVSKVATTFERLDDNKVENLSEMKTFNKEEKSVSPSYKDINALGDAVTGYEDITDKLLDDHTNDDEFQSTEDLEINLNNKSERFVKKLARGFDHSSKYPYIKPPRFIKKGKFAFRHSKSICFNSYFLLLKPVQRKAIAIRSLLFMLFRTRRKVIQNGPTFDCKVSLIFPSL